MEKIPTTDPSEQGLIENLKEYILLRFDLLKLNTVEKSSSVLSLIFGFLVGSLLIFLAVIFLSFAFIYWLGDLFGSMIPGLLIVGGFFILLFIFFYFFREKLLLNPIIRKMSALFFENDPNDDDD